MRVVPLNRLLIQPTVQLSWIEQHRRIEFVLDAALQALFNRLWSLYQADSAVTVPAFLTSASAQPFNLVDDDRLFALLVGADYIQKKYPQFRVELGQANLVWAI